MNSIKLIELDDNTSIIITYSGHKIYFDLPVKVYLQIENKQLLLVDDILGYVLKELSYHLVEAKDNILCDELLESDIGLAQNEYYHRIGSGIPLDILLVSEESGTWIGEKYSCFESKHFSTWIYEINGTLYLKVTPLYPYHFNDGAEELYSVFVDHYKVIYVSELKNDTLEYSRKIIKKLSKQVCFKKIYC